MQSGLPGEFVPVLRRIMAPGRLFGTLLILFKEWGFKDAMAKVIIIKSIKIIFNLTKF